MPEQDKDKLGSFFRKVAAKPDIAFHEEDWKKLEARLDARQNILKKTRNKVTGTVVLTVVLLSGVYFLKNGFERQADTAITQAGGKEVLRAHPASEPTTDKESSVTKPVQKENVIPTNSKAPDVKSSAKSNQRRSSDQDASATSTNQDDVQKYRPIHDVTKETELSAHQRLSDHDDLVIGGAAQTLPASADQSKQKADPELPDAEERNEEVVVKEEFAFKQMKQLTSPRLSLLLSLAPDFSSISFNDYGDPGGAFGLALHYHIKNSWSISAGIVKSRKKYTGDGEDYHPPTGYWKHYTNGVIPVSVDGTCNVLEIPIMIQYTIATVGKSKFLAGVGASSYIMLDESYQYNFEDPNPGARQGWDSKRSSFCPLNMINVAVAYEYQVLPRLRLGIEPYLKIPLEGIGWSDIKLYSTGASLTFRYTVLNKEHSPTRSRGPD